MTFHPQHIEGITTMQTPSIGRIVHYQAHGSPDGTHKAVPRAALITAVHDDTTVDLMVCSPTGLYFNQKTVLDESESPKGGTSRWPPRA
jgi:hypothetical protein